MVRCSEWCPEPGPSVRDRISFRKTRLVDHKAVLGLLLILFTLPETFAQNVGVELIKAAQAGRIVRLRALLGVGLDPNIRDKDGWTALMRAAESGRVDCVVALLAADGDIDAKHKSGASALLAAAYMGHAQMILTLVKHGADIARRIVGGLPRIQGRDEGAAGRGRGLESENQEGHHRLDRGDA